MSESSNYRNRDLIRDLWKFLRPHKKNILIGSILRASSDLVWLIPAIILGKIINLLIAGPGENYKTILLLLAIWIAIVIYHGIIRQIAKYLVYNAAERAAYETIHKAMSHMMLLDISWHETENSGNKLKRVLRGIEGINHIPRMYVDLMIESSINIVGVTIILSTFNGTLSLLMIPFIIGYFFLSHHLLKKAKEQSHKVNIEEEGLYGNAFEIINNITTIKWMGLNRIIETTKAVVQRVIAEVRLRIRYFQTREAVMQIFNNTYRLLLLLFIIHQIYLGNLEVGIIATFMFYFGKLEEASNEYSLIATQFVIHKLGIMRMMEVMNEKPSVEMTGTKLFRSTWKELRIENLSFGYQHKKYLDHLNLTIKRGEKIGIVGLSGAGKTTLFKLLLKLYENYEGKIFFDKTPLSQIKRESYLSHSAVVLQETELFNLSLEDNIYLSGKKRDHNELNKVMSISHIDDFLNKMPEKEKTLIGEKGIKLSGGERQRVGIARAIYKNPQILFMDEATSHLDIDSEELIQDSLKKFFKNVTAIVIAHRLSTIKEMDRIIVMKSGSIIEQGSFQNLMKKKGEFFRLWRKQGKKK